MGKAAIPFLTTFAILLTIASPGVRAAKRARTVQDYDLQAERFEARSAQAAKMAEHWSRFAGYGKKPNPWDSEMRLAEYYRREAANARAMATAQREISASAGDRNGSSRPGH